ncbi:unnamed protein product [Caenorhabditis angaria]|uniref:Cystatin domain-containing protein n=1 Tax=Caenorhabditis angaria TaxID=860376 RepID=A0A9P1IQJ3_9PELO|nr:unnamed protein product [Caenorhabditis angaria]
MQNLVFFIVFNCIIAKCSAMVGGITNQDANNQKYTDLAWKAVAQINNQSSNNRSYYYVPIKVVKASTQVVGGLSTDLEVLAGESSCKKGELQAQQISASNCQAKQGGSRALIKVNIWEKPWENFEQINAEKIRDVSANEQF